jgi:signal transduction histidine kinase
MKRVLEPGFLQAYRLFLVSRLVFWVVIGPILAVINIARPETLVPEVTIDAALVEKLTLPNVAPILFIELLLLALLTLPAARHRLGSWFLPITLTLGLVPLLVGYYWWPSANPLQTPFVIFFFVMLVLIAWQYAFPYVIAYVLGLTLYQYLVSSAGRIVPWTVDVSWLILQGAMMLLVGYIIVALISVQREQREALAESYRQQTEANARLKLYAATLEDLTISRERNRLARELHDTLAHSLSALTVELEAIRALWATDPGAALQMLDNADRTARRGLQEARRALQDLRASPLQDLGLTLALQELAETAAQRTGASLQLDLPRHSDGAHSDGAHSDGAHSDGAHSDGAHSDGAHSDGAHSNATLSPGAHSDGVDANLAPEVEQGVYRIAQEALENIVRHAQAQHISLSLKRDQGLVRLCIEDDGQGVAGTLDPGRPAERARGMGIQGMEERASLIGGTLAITGQTGSGTSVTLTVPCATAPVSGNSRSGDNL